MNEDRTQELIFQYHVGIIAYLGICSKNITKAIWWISLGWLITIISSVLWSLGYESLDLIWVPGAAMMLTGLTALYRQKKRMEIVSRELEETNSWEG